MVNALCGALAEHRAAGVRDAARRASHVSRRVQRRNWPDVVAALRARRDYPALFMALEQAGLRRGRDVCGGRTARGAAVSRIDDVERSITAVRQFQGAVALTLNARIADTLTAAAAETLIESLAAAALVDGRYDGRIVEWLVQQWLPAVRQGMRARDGLSAEQTVAAALAGPATRGVANAPLGRPRIRGRSRRHHCASACSRFARDNAASRSIPSWRCIKPRARDASRRRAFAPSTAICSRAADRVRRRCARSRRGD